MDPQLPLDDIQFFIQVHPSSTSTTPSWVGMSNGVLTVEKQPNCKWNYSHTHKAFQLVSKGHNIKQDEKIFLSNQSKHTQKQEFKISEINKEIELKIPEPVPYAPIQFYDGERHVSYTDCWQISVLRFLHLIFGQEGKINMQNLKKYMELNSKHCKKLVHYFQENNTYSYERKFYETQQGFAIRSNWCQFLNKSKLLHVKINGKYEVAATIPNLISFFRGFFPKLKIKIEQIKSLTYENVLTRQLFESYELVLNEIYSQLSFDFALSIKITSTLIYEKDYLYFNSVQNMSLNGKHRLDWQIYESYDMVKKEITDRLSGHSDYRFC